MCGIFGYYVFNVSTDINSVLNALFNGLKRLEYRGYDSAGVAVDVVDVYPLVQAAVSNADGDPILEENGDHGAASPLVVKEVGKVAQLEKLAHEITTAGSIDLELTFKSHVGIAHTRWATHGVPSAKNSHPQVSDADAEFCVVHNGIITNYKLLKDFLINHGETFESETDTEVIPKLCRFVYQRLSVKVPFPKLVMEVLKKLEGAYAVLVKSTHYPGQLVACKRGSPLIMGIKDHSGMGRRNSFNRIHDADDKKWRSESIEVWVASDTSAILEHTKRAIVLEDNDVLHLTGGGYGIYNTEHQDVEEAVPRVLQTLQMEVESILKGGYDHYMQKEIHEQPESLLQTMSGRVQFQRQAVGNPYTSPRIKLGGFVETAPAIRK